MIADSFAEVYRVYSEEKNDCRRKRDLLATARVIYEMAQDLRPLQQR